MAKLKGKAKAAFLKRINKGRLKKGLKTIKAKTSRKSNKKPGPKQPKPSKSRRISQGRNTTKKRRSTVAKKRRAPSKSKFGIPSIVKKAAAGIGLATIATVVVSQVAPQAAPIVRPIAAFIGGGLPGTVADLLLSGGAGFLGNLFGGGSTGGQEQSV